MTKRADIVLIDGEIKITLPNAFVLIHVDDDRADWRKGWSGSAVDWAWEEKGAFFLFELKDPECLGAVTHQISPSHTKKVIVKLTDATFPNEFAKNVIDTLNNQPYCKSASNARYIVLAAISSPDFISIVADTASLIIKRHLFQHNIDIPVVVLNLETWNSQLAPCLAERCSE